MRGGSDPMLIELASRECIKVECRLWARIGAAVSMRRAKADMLRKSHTPARRIRPSQPAWRTIKRVWLRFATPAVRGYMICATPRSGSNYVSQLLASTGLLGNPREYFNAPGRRHYDDPNYPKDPREQLKQVLTTGRTVNGIYAVKMHYFQIAALKQVVDPFRDLPHLRFIVLERRDILGQAISWSRARQTSQVRASDSTRRAANYNQSQIRQSLLWLMDERAKWEKTLQDLKARPLLLTYEAIMKDPHIAADRVAAFMEIDKQPRIDSALVSVTIQRDQTSEDWRARFLAETGDEFRQLADALPDREQLALRAESR